MNCSIIFRPAWLRGLARRHTVQVASFPAGGLLTVALVTGSATHITARAVHRERPAVVPPARVAVVILPGVRLGPDGKLHDAYAPTDLTALAGQKEGVERCAIIGELMRAVTSRSSASWPGSDGWDGYVHVPASMLLIPRWLCS